MFYFFHNLKERCLQYEAMKGVLSGSRHEIMVTHLVMTVRMEGKEPTGEKDVEGNSPAFAN